MQVVPLSNVPVIDGRETVLLRNEGDVQGDCYVAQRSVDDPESAPGVVAFIDGATANGYAADGVAPPGHPTPKQQGQPPLVRIVGEVTGSDGQVTILQEEGHYRRYSRWDAIEPYAGRPKAAVRTLPQCGCGGYLGAPMVFDSFAEMTAYFFVVFSDAAAVNAKHAANICGC